MLGLIGLNLSGQTFKCASAEILKENLLKDPSLKARMDSIEQQTQLWILNNKRYPNYTVNSTKGFNKSQTTQNTASFCSYFNTYYTTITGPTVLNQTATPSINCVYGGEYVRVTGLIAGRVYRIATCGVNNYDTQISIYTQGGGTPVAHNDDACGIQSEIYFNPLTSGNYDIQVTAFNCLTNTLCANLAVQLVYIPRPVIIIPTVVHVIHYGEAIGSGRNISTAQIQSQITALNQDFRRLNADINTVGAGMRGYSDDPLIQFCLAQQDEFGNPTTGIKRWLATNPQVTKNDMLISIKPTTIWDRNKYLNLWTVDFAASEGGLIGYAEFPGGPANIDGVVLRYDAFGTIGSVLPPYDKGRAGTHEIGHWLNLHHVWGDDLGACTGNPVGSDFVFDTPNQTNMNFGCPAYPLTDACSPNYPGVMHMNYMDYTDDACKKMFTYGQAARMDATLFGPRLSLQSSNGCLPSTVGINESALNESALIYPNPSSGLFNIKLNSLFHYNVSISVLNVVGQKVLDISNADNMTVINLSSQPNGVYFIQINSGNETFNKKVILNK